MSARSTPHLPADRPPGAPWPIPDAARYLGVSDRHLYRLAERDLIVLIRLGRRRLMPAEEVDRLAREGC